MTPHFFNANDIAWTEHPQFKGLFIKVLETRATNASASVTLTRLAVGQSIGAHTHAIETETVYLLQGRARLLHDSVEAIIEAGGGVSIPPGIAHSLHNSGDVPLELIAFHAPPVR